MRTQVKVLAVAACVGITVFCTHRALAGNVDQTSIAAGNSNVAPIWELDQPLHFFSTWTSPSNNADEILLIDEVVYSTDIDPCDVDERCQLFPRETLLLFGEEMEFPNLVSQNATGITNSNAFGFLTRFARARGTHFTACLAAGIPAPPPTGTFRIFDRMSHSMYSMIVGREESGNVGFGDAYYGVSLSGSVTAVETSQARHYQTPVIVLKDDFISFFDLGPPAGALPSGESHYTKGQAVMRGRWIQSGVDRPTRAPITFTFGQ